MHTYQAHQTIQYLFRKEQVLMSNNNSLKVLLAGAECAPFVKLGGLADVMGTLPKELNQIGATDKFTLKTLLSTVVKAPYMKEEYANQ